MNHDSEAESRAKFEAWADKRGLYLSDRFMYWEGWRAALMSRQAPSTPDVSQEGGKGDTWQDIETAPKDQFLLLAVEFDHPGDWRIKMGEFCTNPRRYGWNIMGASWTPTHWMPLPPPPDGCQRAGGGT